MVGVGLNQGTVKMPSICERLRSRSSNEGDTKQSFIDRDTASVKFLRCHQENTSELI